jgi:uridylate kinase
MQRSQKDTRNNIMAAKAKKQSRKSRFNRIIIKLSGEALRNRETGLSIDPGIAMSVAKQVKAVVSMKVQIAIVIGGGNIIRGMAGQAQGMSRIAGDSMGMLATVINALALKDALEKVGVDARVQTAVRMDQLAEPLIIGRALAHLSKGRVVIFAGGTGNPFFTTDTTAALRASEIGADALLKATKVDGIYSDDPEKNPRATRFKTLSYADALKNQLKIMDAAAFSLCMENRIPIIVFDFFRAGNIKRVLEGRPVGTVVS